MHYRKSASWSVGDVGDFEKIQSMHTHLHAGKRFTELCKRQRQRKRMHYIDMMARQFNQDLLADQQQLCLIPHEFSDEERLAELVRTLLRDLEATSTSFATMSWCYLTQWDIG